jgi:hypothetical protein
MALNFDEATETVVRKKNTWSSAEQAYLKDRASHGIGIGKLAKILGRTEGSVRGKWYQIAEKSVGMEEIQREYDRLVAAERLPLEVDY